MLTVFLSAVPYWPDAPEWLTTRVLACGVVAVALAVVAVLLKGLQKVITLLIALAVLLGGFWFIQDTWKGRALPPDLARELDGLAARTLEHRDARSAWEAIQRDLDNWTGDAKSRLAAGGESARGAIAKRVDAKVAEMRKQGKKAASDELHRLRQQITPTERLPR